MLHFNRHFGSRALKQLQRSSSVAAPCLVRAFAAQPTAWNTKIVCTIGPASSDEDTLEKLILAGMDVCRLNFSHGKYDVHQETFDKIRRLGQKYGHQIGILCDIQGPKIRTGKMTEAFEVKKGDAIRVTPDEVMGTPELIQISYETLVQDLDAGDIIFINDGTVKLEVVGKDVAKKELLCEVKTAGKISDNKGCNMPSGRLSVNVVTEKDAHDLEYIAKHMDPEFVAASFVGSGDDVRKVRAELSKAGNDKIKIIAKLERPVALENLEEIVEESDSIMIARGDLGVEIDAWDVPAWQKKAIFLANKNSKPVIVATQMLESMIDNARPTRAEASDVFNAVVDGADAVMLSGETSVGKYPVTAVRTMDEIVRVAQDHVPKHDPEQFHSGKDAIAEDVCKAVHSFAERFKNSMKTGKVIILTTSGFAARQLAKYRPSLPMLAFSEELRTVRELALCWGVKAHYLPIDENSNNVEDRAISAIKEARELGFLSIDTDERVAVLMPATHGSAAYWCSVFDLEKLRL
ncbi:hypothetical protein ACHAXR_006934 [Thalassiosira sp. AJA248-18]